MKNKHTLLAGAFALLFAVLSTAVYGYSWKSFDGTGEWPTSGDVLIPNGKTVTVDDDHVDAVAGWQNVYLENTLSKLVFANATKPATYNAADTCGSGVVRVESTSCGLTINSTNPNRKFSLPGHYEFDNAVVTVTTDNGLCPGGTAYLTFPANGSVGDLRFHKPAWDAPDFEGTKAITNRCTLFFNCAAKANVVRAYAGSLAMDEYFVQNAGLYMVPNGSNKFMGLRNNYEQISGEFGTCSESYNTTSWTGQNPWYSATAGAQIRFTGTTAITQNSLNGVLGCLLLGSSADWYFGASGGYHSTSLSMNVGVCHFLADNVLHDTATSTIPNPPPKYVVLSPYLLSQESTSSTNGWNLHGHSQTVAGISSSTTITSTSTGYHVFASAEPATLTLAEGWQQYYSSAKYMTTTRGKRYTSASCFTGSISIDVANAATNVFATKVSSATGTITIRNDSTVEYKWKGGWSSKIVVEDSGTLLFDENNTALTAWPEVEAKAGGKLVLASDVTAMKFASLKFGDTVIPPSDYYTLGGLKAKYGIGDYVEGADSVKVEVGLWQTFDGTGAWPTSGKVSIPKGKVVVVDDEHVAAVAGWDALYFAGTTARLSFSNANTPAALNMSDISGNGVIGAMNSCGLTVNAENANKKFYGTWRITNSNVIVKHEYGLGSKSAKAYFYYTDYDDPLLGTLSFHDAKWDEPGFTGVKAITNHCALFFNQSDAKKNYQHVRVYVGSDAMDEYFVQDGSVYMAPSGGYKMLGLKNNYEQISGEFGTCNDYYDPNVYTGQHAWYAATEGAQIRFNGTTAIKNNGMNGNNDWMLSITVLGSAADWYLGASGGMHANAIAPLAGVWHVMTDNPLHDTADSQVVTPPAKYVGLTPYARTQDSPANTNAWNLHGHELTVAGLGLQNADEVTATSTIYDIFDSAEPATLKLAEGWSTYYVIKTKTRGGRYTGAPLFTGAVSVEAANAATNVFVTKVSKPTGTLTIKNDTTVLYKWGGAWASDMVIRETGKLVVDATAGSFKGANLVIDEGGVVEVAADTTMKVGEIIYNGESIPRGTYTASDFGFIKGEGEIYVKGPKCGLIMMIK